jgi:hypothetical protein
MNSHRNVVVRHVFPAGPERVVETFGEARRAALLPFIATATDEEVREQFDELVVRAVGGDRRAIGAIAIALGPTLLKEARQALGEGREHQAGDVVQRLFLAMVEGTMVFAGERGTGLEWMKRIVREGARYPSPDDPGGAR